MNHATSIYLISSNKPRSVQCEAVAEKFSGIPWTVENGLPRLAGASWIPCSLDSLVDGGDHVIALGTARNVDTGGGIPLTYWRRTLGTQVPVSGS
jgi:flavin reductase (DIM6/NTAB) family NADH-FMN oxidoreductase RutF